MKLVELAPGAQGQPRLLRYAIEAVDRGAIVDGNIENPESVAAALNRALRRLGSRTRDVALALPASAVITKRITLPAGLSEDEYEIQVESEASQYIPFAIEEVNLDFQLLGPTGSSDDEVEVLLAASRKEKVEDRVAVAEMCGLHPVVVDIDAYASRQVLDRVARQWPGETQGQIVACFDLGGSLTRATVLLDGDLVFERDHAFGGAQLTQDIVRVYGVTPEEAEVRKRTADLPDNYASEVLRPFVEQGATDIARALQFFFTSTPHSRVDRIYLCGGSSVLPGLVEAVSERTQVPVALLSPFEGMEVAEGIRDKALKADAPSLVTACGLALRRFEA